MTKVPNGLNTLKQKVSDYFQNPQKFIDMTRGQAKPYRDPNTYDYGPGMCFPIKSIEDVCGIKLLGSGCYSDVYAIDETRVLKIVKNEDSGYAAFATECRKYRSNPHFPIIYYSGEWGGKTVYILERLSENPTSGDYTLNEYFRDAVRSGRNPYMGHATKHIAEIAKVLREKSLCNDLHAGNLMFRGDVPVVTDPAS